MIQPLVTRLAFLSPDLPGYEALEAWTADTRSSLDDEAEQLAALLPAGSPAHLVGYAYGGAIALQMALRWPDRIASLTLYEPIRFGLLLQGDGAAAARNEIMTIANRFKSAVLSGRCEEAAAVLTDHWNGPGTWAAIDKRKRRRQIAAVPKEGALKPLSLRTYCSDASRISCSVAGGSKLKSVLMFRHMANSLQERARRSAR